MGHKCTSRCGKYSHVLTRKELIAIMNATAEHRCGLTALEIVQCFKTDAVDYRDLNCVDILGMAGLLKRGDPLYVRP